MRTAMALAGVKHAPSAPVRSAPEEEKYPHMLMILGLMELRLKKNGFQLLKTLCYLSPATRLNRTVNDILLFLFH